MVILAKAPNMGIVAADMSTVVALQNIALPTTVFHPSVNASLASLHPLLHRTSLPSHPPPRTPGIQLIQMASLLYLVSRAATAHARKPMGQFTKLSAALNSKSSAVSIMKVATFGYMRREAMGSLLNRYRSASMHVPNFRSVSMCHGSTNTARAELAI